MKNSNRRLKFEKKDWIARIPGLGHIDPVTDVYRRIYAAISRIPRGKVATYGAIARWARVPNPRQVGYALRTIPEGVVVPWHRIVNAQGKISERSDPDGNEIQRLLLESERVEFLANGRVDLRRFSWPGPQRSDVQT